MSVGNGRRRPMASVWVDNVPWVVAETASEAAELVEEGAQEDDRLVRLTIANQHDDWNGKALYVRPSYVRAISPPRSTEDDDEDDDG